MRKKLKDLCASFPKAARLQSPMDNVATEIFKSAHDRYIQSSTPPEKRYGIEVNKTLLQYHNDHLDDFPGNYGPNERYLINKILFSPYNLICVVGGIGVGKTTFSHYFMDMVMKKLRHELPPSSHCPCPIYFNFVDVGAGTLKASDFEKTQVIFSELLCDRIDHEMEERKYMSRDEEIGQVWEDMLAEDKHKRNKNTALSFIAAQLRTENAGAERLKTNYQETIEKRAEIRKRVVRDPTYRRFYVAALIKYIKTKYYGNHPHCFVIIVDNIDREPTAVQHGIKMVLKPFARISTAKVIINVRQSTYYQALDDDASEVIDEVPYCGVNPSEIVLSRIRNFIENSDAHANFYPKAALPTLVKGVAALGELMKRDWFSAYFLSFTGRSVRKALTLAQHLIDNSVYDLYDIGRTDTNSLKQSDVMRALMVGANNTFHWHERGLIDNLFEVHQPNNNGYLVKLRILRMLSRNSERGFEVQAAHTVLNGFGYDTVLIKDALNELMPSSKRLIWCNEVKDFTDTADLVGHSHAHLVTTTIGIAYQQTLFKMLEYIQEVMLDTSVDSVEFGDGWDYGRMEDRLKLVSLFCKMLLDCDMAEVKKYVSSYGRDSYVQWFGSQKLISREILESVKIGVENILRYVKGHTRSPSGSFSDFVEEHTVFYKDRLVIADRFEREYL